MMKEMDGKRVAVLKASHSTTRKKLKNECFQYLQ